MKFIKSALAGLALSAVSLAAHAGFTASLSGPSALRPWYSGTFELTLQYTPMALTYRSDDVEGVPGMIEFGYMQATTTGFTSIVYKEGSEYARYYGLPNPKPSPAWTFDLAQPASFKRSFAWAAGDAGNYEIALLIGTFEQTYRGPNALCRSIPQCASNGRFFDSDEFYSYTSAHLGIDVTPTAPIPEPQTYALMLAGLGLVSAFARSVHQKSAQAKATPRPSGQTHRNG